MKQTLVVLFIFTLMVGSLTAIYKLVNPYVDFASVENLTILRSGGLFISINGGESWVKPDVKGGKLSNLFVYDFEYYNQDNSLQILLGALNGVYHSGDNGLSWERVYSKYIRRRVFDIAIDTTQLPVVLYIATENNEGRGVIMKSVDGGVTFNPIFTLTTRGEQIIGLALNSVSRSTIFGLTSRGSFLKSIDAGKSWSKIEISVLRFNKLFVDSKDSRVMYATTLGAGFFRSIDGGSSWENLRTALAPFPGSQVINDFDVSEVLNSTIYLGSNFGILRSQDRGVTFQEVPFLIPTGTVPITAVEADSHRLSTVYAGVKNQIYKSVDGASTWQVSAINTSGTVNFISVNPSNADIIYAGIDGS